VSSEKTLTLGPFAEEHAETVLGWNGSAEEFESPNEAVDSAAAWSAF
jgi:hypothetical protein